MIYSNGVEVTGKKNSLYYQGKKIAKVFYNGSRYLNRTDSGGNEHYPYCGDVAHCICFKLDKTYTLKSMLEVNTLLIGWTYSYISNVRYKLVSHETTLGFNGYSTITAPYILSKVKSLTKSIDASQESSLGITLIWRFYDRYQSSLPIAMRKTSSYGISQGHDSWVESTESAGADQIWGESDFFGSAPLSESCLSSVWFNKDMNLTIN